METSELLSSIVFKKESNARTPAGRFFVVFIPSAVLLLLISGYLIYSDLRRLNEGILKDETVVVTRGAGVVRDSLREAVSDTQLLAKMSESVLGIDREDLAFERDLTQRFKLFANAKRTYKQVRLIDTNGVERIRVNYDNGAAAEIPRDLLQHKLERYYVLEGLKLRPGQVYVSRFDLNIENGIIEKPVKPMVRIVAPVIGPDRIMQGIVVTNVDGLAILDSFSQSILPDDDHAMLVDQFGYILRGANEEEAWAFMFDRADLSLQSRYPYSWNRIAQEQMGQFEDQIGLWTFRTIYPVGKTLTRGQRVYDWDYLPKDYNWKVVTLQTTQQLAAKRWRHASASILFSCLLLVTLAVGAGALARTQSALVAHGAKLEQTVEKRTAELRATNEDLSKARVRAEAASDAKSRFLANMSHELRTPLNAISGFSDIIREEMLGPIGNDTYKSYASDISSSAKHLTNLIQDLIDISQIEADAVTLRDSEIDVAGVVRECRLIIAGNASAKGVKLTGDISPGLPMLRADPTRVRQILINLLTNAVKFTPSGGVVTLSVFLDDRSRIHIKVADTGRGIPDALKSEMFRPFARGDDPGLQSSEGVGLGLAITHSLVELHGGEITVDSELGKGTTFEIAFPPERTVKNA